VYFKKKDDDKAVSDLSEAIRLKSNYAEAYYWRGRVYGVKGDRHRAIADYESALRIDPSHSNAQKALSDARNALENKTASPPVDDGASNNVFTDSRDGKKYRTVKIGNQTWMAENLNSAVKGSKCYDDKPENCNKYGRLYDWAMAKKICPSGWHLPSKSEYDVLDKSVGGKEVVGKKLKAKNGWNGTDEFGFSALSGGYGFSDGSFSSVGVNSLWWNASQRVQ
jgi:uncharacterized protein (TIGR02145 family)